MKLVPEKNVVRAEPQAEEKSSRLPGFYKLTPEQRQHEVSLWSGEPDVAAQLAMGGLSIERADKVVENVYGTHSLPLALALNFQINHRDYIVPMAVEEPSVVAAASSAAKVVRANGGFVAESDPAWMIAQVHLDEVQDTASAAANVAANKSEILSRVDAALTSLVARGGGARDVELRVLAPDVVVVHLIIDCCDAMGANLVNTAAEAVAPLLEKLCLGRIGLRILSNLADRRLVRVKCLLGPNTLECEGFSGVAVRDGIVRASRFASLDVYRAATHNKGIMNGVDPVIIATGNDWRAVEAGAHAFAAHNGYKPLCTWSVSEATESRGYLQGLMTMPMALGVVGGTLRVHTGAQLALKTLGNPSAQELGMIAACVGMASNFAALRALSTVGIQRGHMSLHARSVALAAGAEGDEVEAVAHAIHEKGDVSRDAAEKALLALRKAVPTA